MSYQKLGIFIIKMNRDWSSKRSQRQQKAVSPGWLRDCVRELIRLQVEETENTETKIQAEQRKLNTLYDSYTEEWGLLNSIANKRAFSEDSSYPLLCSLERLDEDGNLAGKADMFSKRTGKRKVSLVSILRTKPLLCL